MHTNRQTLNRVWELNALKLYKYTEDRSMHILLDYDIRHKYSDG